MEKTDSKVLYFGMIVYIIALAIRVFDVYRAHGSKTHY